MNDQIPGMTYRAPTAIGNNEESQGGEKMVVALQTRADVKPEREELYRLFEQGDLVPGEPRARQTERAAIVAKYSKKKAA